MEESNLGQIKNADPLWLAMSRYRRRKFNSSISICNNILQDHGPDVAALYLKTRATTVESYIDDADFQEEEGIAEMVLDENATATLPRPGTSLNSVSRRAGSFTMRPISSSGRPITGFIRPGSSRPIHTPGSSENSGGLSSSHGLMEHALRPGSSRPATSLGREVRMTTASIELTNGGNSINTTRLNMQTIGTKPPLAFAIVEHLLFIEIDPKRALELASECTKFTGYKDWWWKYMIGKSYNKLGLYREAEKQLKSSLNHQSMVITHLELMKVFLKLDIPKTALKYLLSAHELHSNEPRLLLAIARIHDQLNNNDEAAYYYRQTLKVDASSIEAIACLASHHYYNSEPEVSLRFYRRIIQMGINVAEVWSNIGLCCYYSSQFDMSLSCFERALQLSNDGLVLSDIWYNISQVSIGIGDSNLGYQSLKIAISLNPDNAEAFSNISVLEYHKAASTVKEMNHSSSSSSSSSSSLSQKHGNNDEDDDHLLDKSGKSQTAMTMAQKLAPHLFEPCFNGSLLAYRQGKFSKSYSLIKLSLAANPGHAESQDLLHELDKIFSVL